MQRLNMSGTFQVCRVVGLYLLIAALTGVFPSLLQAGSTGTTELLTPQGEDSTTALGDFVADTGGLDTYYSYFIEVPDDAGRLVIEIFDADIGAGGGGEAAAGRDRARTVFNSSVDYQLVDPNGTSIATQFTTGNTTAPAGADNAWLTLFDSNVATTGPTPTLQGGNIATSSSNVTSISIPVPGGTAANDLLIATVATDGSPTISPSATGWTTLNQGSAAGGAAQLAIFYRLATASEPASYTFTWSGGQEVVATLANYRGVDTSAPINISAAATGNSAAPTAPTVTTTRGNTLVVRIYGADDDDLSGAPYPAGHTGLFNAQSGNGNGTVSSGGASISQATSGATGGASFSLSNNEQWRAVTLALQPPTTPASAPIPGHWEVRVDMGPGDDINHFGLRAHDGNSGSGGTELPIYYYSFNGYGIQDDGVGTTGASRTYDHYPYVTIGCNVEFNDFDWDIASFGSGSTPIAMTSRTGSFTQSGTTNSANDSWNTTTISGWTTDFTADDYGIWRLDVNIDVNIVGGNYGVVYVGNDTTAATPPTAQPEANTFRVYLPTDAGAAPVKPYVEQFLNHESGPASLTAGQTTGVTVTLRLVNPTGQSLTFSTPNNVVTAHVPGSGATFGGIRSVEQGTVTSQPSLGGTGNIVWNPGTVAAGDTVLLAYDVDLAPTVAGQRVVVTGTPASNGTTAQFVDETCSGASPACSGAQLTGATFTFGPLCELAATEAATATAAVIGTVAAYEENGQVVVEWTTATEAGSVQFEVLREGPRGLERFQPPGPALLDAPAGGIYRVLDPQGDADNPATYWLRETDLRGQQHLYGPFQPTVDRDRQHGAEHEPLTNDFAAWSYLPTPTAAPPALDTAVDAARVGILDLGPAGRRTGVALALGLETSGVYFVSALEIAQQLGRPLGQVRGWLRAGQFFLERNGLPVAWAEARGASGQIGLLFYGEAVESLYSRETVYRLEGGRRGLRMASVEGGSGGAATGTESFAAVRDVEEDAIAATVLGLDPESDYWFWHFLRAGDPATESVTLPIDLEAATGATGRLSVRLHGATDSGVADEHHVQVLLNGTLLGDSWWRGITPHEALFTVPAGVLQEGANAVEIVSVLDPGVPFSIFFLDGFEVTFPRRYATSTGTLRFAAGTNSAALLEGLDPASTQVLDITDPRQPRRVDRTAGGTVRLDLRPGGEYVAVETARIAPPTSIRRIVASDLLAESARGEYLVIAPPGLVTAAEELARYRRDQGLGARVVSVQQIYDHLNGGLTDPRAIREFLSQAWQRWQTPPRWVVLVGNGTYDYRDLLGQGGNLMPPWMLQTPDGLYASDNAFVDLTGDDGVPEISIGRIPVTSAAELRAYLDKIIAYENRSLSGGEGWADRAVLLADAFDQGMDFATSSQGIEPLLPTHYQSLPISLDSNPLGMARDQLFQAWNDGLGMVHYTGHGGLDRLSGIGLLTTPDAAVVGAGAEGRLPLLTAMTCNVNRFEVPGFRPLGAALVLEPGAGAIASWAPTGFSFNAPATQLASHFFHALFTEGATARTLGEVAKTALERLDTLEDPRPLRRIYNLLGDPALTLPIVPPFAGPGGSGEEVQE